MMKRIKLIVLIALAILGLQNSFAQEKTAEETEILYICAYNADTYYSTEFTDIFTQEYTKRGGRYKLVIEAMNCNSLESHAKWLPSMEAIMERHPNAGLVILYGPEAWISYMSLSEAKYKELPLCLISCQRYGARTDYEDVPAIYRTPEDRDRIVDYLELAKEFNVKMCYYYEYDVKNDIKTINALCPDVNTIAIIGDNSFSGYSMLAYTANELHTNYPNITVVEIDGSMEDSESANESILRLPKNSAVIYCIWRYDKKGAISLGQTQQLFDQLNDIPIISLTGRGLGEWALGGSTPQYDWYDGRVQPAELAYELLDNNIDIEPYYYRCPNSLQIDMAILNKLGLDSSNLPDNTIYHNLNQSLWDIISKYRTVFVLSLLVFVLLIITIIVLWLYSIRINRMRIQLEASAEQLKADKLKLEANEHALLLAIEKAEASDQMKTNFIHNISHEIRTPLNVIQGFSQILLDPDSKLDADARNNFSKEIKNNVQFITEVVNDILYYSEIESSTFTVSKHVVNCYNFCKNILSATNNYKKENLELTFTTNISQEDNAIFDDRLVSEVLCQLLRNANKFTEKGGINLNCERSTDNTITFSVSDTGPGIPADKSEFIFERFKKLNVFTQGTGLGLSICRIIANKLNGKVYLDTNYTGGAKFVFTIPVDGEN